MQYSKSIIILLFELGFDIKFNIVGTISISELFLLFFVPFFLIPKVKWENAKNLQNITIAYVFLISIQILSEYIVSNELHNALKGIAITIISYFHFIFLVFFLSQQKSLILILLTSQIARMLIFGSVVEEQTVEDVLTGEAAVYLKFYIAPLVTLVLLAISMIYHHKYFSLIFSLMGIVFIFLGARSSGGIALLTGLVTYLLEHRIFTFNKKILVTSTVVLCLISYLFYAYYVNQVLAGKITSGNNQQILLCNNPYNPLELLMAGRSEAWVGWQAFMDNFWFGHGAWAYDSTGRYQRMMLAMHDELATASRDQISYHFLIPSHSVLIGSGMMNGVFAFLTMGYIVIYFLWKGVRTFIRCENRYKLVVVFYVFSLLWTALFSPQSHFRQTMPVAFAIIFVLNMSNDRERLSLAKSRLLSHGENVLGVFHRRK